ncbi:AzlC family ABC transporter permease [Amorphus coralli]|uniref:AzlC family ABC transporter permease n=1 Tax=Amorphus coralli TaxID=340680 RepID=UPI00035D99CC|nr:AzlC family ABC transporter permease [Amorphus coralli]
MTDTDPAAETSLRWFLKGVTKLVSVPAAVLVTAQIGFVALARDIGFSLPEILVITLSVWALPGQVVYVGALASGSGWIATMLAVSLSSMRFLPMLMSWVPVVRGERSTRLKLLGLSHFVAVTSWVFTMSEMPSTPRQVRLAYFAGFALALVVANLVAITVAYQLVGHVPAWVSAALLMLTPLYFLLALGGAGKVIDDYVAMGMGLLLGPALYAAGIGLDLLWTGIIGGTVAYAVGRVRRRST